MDSTMIDPIEALGHIAANCELSAVGDMLATDREISQLKARAAAPQDAD